MKKLAKIFALAAAVIIVATGCKKLPTFTYTGGGGDTPAVVTPTVTTVEATEITETFAMLNGVITNYDANYTYETGFYFGTTETLDSFISADDFGHGAFGTKFAGLTANTTYYYKAYAIISGASHENAGYGDVKSFTTTGGGSGNAPEGAINGLFTINSNGNQVYFSKGNLQYQASTNIWRFAENQWNFVGDEESGNVYENSIKCNNKQISQTYTGWIDLFGWGTSGYNHGAECYQPWSTSTNYNNYNVYGSTTYNLSDQNGKADWGYNAIINGGNAENLWRTLTSDEWNYVFNNRITNTSIRYAKAQVNGVNGMLLLPDEWSTDYYALNNTDNPNATYSTNVISTYDWTNNLESFGAVFLPACSFREGTSMGYVGIEGDYWSATHYTTIDNAYRVYFYIDLFGANSSYHRHCGHGVRLVHNAGN